MSRIRRWLWEPTRDGENWAQTLVRVIGNLFRDALTALVVLIVVPVLGWGGYTLWNNQFSEIKLVSGGVTHRATSEVKIEKGIDICNEDYPLGVYLRNESGKTLQSVTLDVTARERGAATNVLPWDEDSISVEHIVPPGYEYFTCYRNSTALDRQDLVYSGTVAPSSVELVPPEDWHFKETEADLIAK